MAMSYAAAARPKKKQPAPGRPPPKGTTTHCDRLQVSPENQSRINQSERRTQVLRRVPPTTTSGFIITELDRQLDAPITDFVEAVVQDCLDRRRYYIRYVSIEKKREVTRRGFQLGDIRIPGERADITGFVKDVPHYLTHEDMMSILGRYGDVVHGGFLTFGETNIRCGGFRFELDLHENTKLPNSIRILNDIMTVSQKDDHKKCGYCDRIGHITPHCRQRTEALEKRAMVELKQQENAIRQDEIQDEDMSGTSSEEYSDDEREGSQTTATPPPPQQTTHQSTQPTSSQTTDTPKSVTFVSGGNLDTVSEETYTTPNEQQPSKKTLADQQSHLDGGDDILISANPDDDEAIVRTAKYSVLNKEKKEQLNIIKARINESLYPMGPLTEEKIQQLNDQLFKELNDEMRIKYKTLWENFAKEHNRRQKQMEAQILELQKQ